MPGKDRRRHGATTTHGGASRIVEDYIRSQEPIGSAALTKKHDLGVSSATIRNDMASLEEEGYLIQPHTSSGRIPTEKGYRYFVDRLSTVVPLSDAQRKGIAAFLSGSVSLQDTLQRAARLLSHITGQVAVVASPSPAKAKVLRVQIVPVSSTLLLIVVITDAGNVAQHTLALSPQPTDITLADVGSVVNGAWPRAHLRAGCRTVRSLSRRGGNPLRCLKGWHRCSRRWETTKGPVNCIWPARRTWPIGVTSPTWRRCSTRWRSRSC